MTSPNTDEPLCNVARLHVEAEGWYRNKGMGIVNNGADKQDKWQRSG